MAKAKKVKQISIEMADKPGLLAEVTAAVAGAKVNISAICAYAMEGKAYFMLQTDGNAKAKKALSKIGATVKEEEVCAVDIPNKPGELRKVAERIAAAGINLYYIYGTSGAGKTATCIFSSADDKAAIKAINK